MSVYLQFTKPRLSEETGKNSLPTSTSPCSDSQSGGVPALGFLVKYRPMQQSACFLRLEQLTPNNECL